MQGGFFIWNIRTYTQNCSCDPASQLLYAVSEKKEGLSSEKRLMKEDFYH